MKKVKIDIQDLLTVLNAMVDSGGTTEIIFFEHNNLPAIRDANDEDSCITFETFDESEDKDGNIRH